jgi:DNA-binding LytR/AlgR family response regulator
MRRVTAIIAEDELHLRDELREALAELWPELEIIGLAENGIEALHLMEAKSPDILFLDVQMPGLTGLEVAARANGQCRVVFVTAYDEHAVAAFEQGAIDYVMKPFSMLRLANAVARLKERLESAPVHLSELLRYLNPSDAEPRKWLRWINASIGNTVRLITVDEILYFQSDSRMTQVMTAHHESVIRRPIKDLLKQLDPDVFWQIHRSTVVNVHAIEDVHRAFTGHCELRLKHRPERLQVSTPYVHLFKQM